MGNATSDEIAAEGAMQGAAKGDVDRKNSRQQKWLFVLRLVVAFCLVASMAAIWLLTEQDSTASGALSASVEAALERNASSSSDEDSASGKEASDEISVSSDGASDSGGEGTAAGKGEAGGAAIEHSGNSIAGEMANPDVLLRLEATETPSIDIVETGGIAGAIAALCASVSESVFALADWFVALFGVRRMAHVVEFFVMGLFAAMLALLWPTRKGFRCVALGLSVVLCLVWSVLDQVHKMFVPGRHFDGVDLVFDAVGYLAATALVVLVWICVRRLGSARSARTALYSR